MTGFETRPLGRTGLRLTVLGLGTATMGGHRVPVTRETAEAVVRAAWAAGLRHFDTAPFYGFGQSERCVGDALRAVPRDEWVLSTKVGRRLRPRTGPTATAGRQHPMPFELVFDYTYDGIMRAFEDSLQRLGLARIDILYVHDIGARQHQDAHLEVMRTFRGSGYRALEELRRSGVVRAIGIGVQEREVLLEAMEWGAWDVFLLAARYTLLEQAGLDDLFPKCLESGISIVIGAPHNTGILAGRDSWNYRPPPPEIAARVNALSAVCGSHGVPLIAAALQFPLAHPAVASVLPGPRDVEEFEADVKLLRYPIPPALWADLRRAKLLHPDAPTPA
ncbi:MAG TPA: aldo/keto reductase [Stellaceae bacterium]|nr:aldo/keto reductase [Stellaceae bacterium]